MADESNVVGVLRQHLEDIHGVLELCSTYFGALDLAENIKSGTPSPKASRTTQRVSKAQDRVAGYLEIEEDEDELLN
jgi:hypothetical protein